MAYALAGQLYRHVATGGTYIVLFIGKMQTKHWLDGEPDTREAGDLLSVDMEPVVVYYSVKDGSVWVRPQKEFEDGRFEHQ